MNLDIHPEVADDFMIKSTNLENDNQILQFEFKGKKRIAIYQNKDFIIMMANINILKMMVDIKHCQLAVVISDNSSVIINAETLHIFKDNAGHICFLPIADNKEEKVKEDAKDICR